MRIIGVVDLLGGRAVHARAGDRHKYAPVASVAGDAVRLARQYLAAGMTDLYVADLGAILSHTPHDALIASLADLGTPLWVDGGVSSVDAARTCLSQGAAHVIVGLETLTSFDALREICDHVGGSRVAFSLDLRSGLPVMNDAGERTSERLATVDQASRLVVDSASRAREAGAGAIIVLDLARIGSRNGVDLDLLRRVREALPDVMLLSGGGIRGATDLSHLATGGCDGALVATAFHDGRLSEEEIRVLTQTSVSR